MAKKKEVTEWRALTGINYVPADKEDEVRVEAGDKITDMTENAVRHERAAGNIEEWVPRETENVRRDGDENDETTIDGVRSRHANDGDDIVVKEVNTNG